MAKPLRVQVNQFLKDVEGIPRELYKQVNKQIDFTELLEDTHEKEQNPYGKNWAQRKHRYNNPILNKTGKLKRSYRQTLSKNRLTISNTASYAKYHQSGTKHMKRRLLLPNPKEGIPVDWWSRIERIFEKLINEIK